MIYQSTKLTIGSFGTAIQVIQWNPHPATVSLNFKRENGEYIDIGMQAHEFISFVAWLNAEAKNIKSDEQILKEMRDRDK